MDRESLDPETRIVIIGAGVVGAALADDLTRIHGMKSVTVVDQGPLFETGGASSHAPGFAFQTTGSQVMSELAKRTIDKLDGAVLDGQWVMKRVGGLELASDQDHLEYLHRRHNYAQSWGIPSEIVTPERCAELFPGIDPAQVLGGLHTPTDAVVKSVRCVEFQGRRAIDNGAVMHGLTEVTGLRIANGTVRGVEVRPVPEVPGNPSQGQPLPAGVDFIPADIVVVCAGMWGPRFAVELGIELPMVPMEHCESWTSTLPDEEMSGYPGQGPLTDEVEIERPLLRHQETGLYLRQYGAGYIWGTYEHRVIPVDQSEISSPKDFARTGIHPAIHDLTASDLDATWSTVNALLPATRQLERIGGMNGIFSFTPDGNPMLGEVAGVDGLWLGESVWLTQSAGVAEILANWIVTGEAGVDTSTLDYKRFDQRHLTHTASVAWASESRGEAYRIAHPRKHSAQLRGISTSPFYPRQQELGAAFGQARGWERPLWYNDPDAVVTGMVSGGWARFGVSGQIITEAENALHGAGIIDRSSDIRVLEVLNGDQALSSLFSWGTLPDIDESRSVFLLTASGGIAGKYTAVRTAEGRFLFTTAVALDEQRLRSALSNINGITINNVSDSYSSLSIVGEQTRELFSVLQAQREIPSAKVLDFFGVPVRALSAPLVSEDDALLIFAPQHGLYVWDTIFGSGVPATPVGYEAFQALRISAGVPEFDVDYGLPDTPVEIGARPGKPRPGRRLLVRLRLAEAGDALISAEPVKTGDRVVGHVTSAAQDPVDRHVRAFAWVDIEALEAPDLTITFLDKELPASIDRTLLAEDTDRTL